MTGRPPADSRRACAVCGRTVAHVDERHAWRHKCPHGNACRARFGTTRSKSCDACVFGHYRSPWAAPPRVIMPHVAPGLASTARRRRAA